MGRLFSYKVGWVKQSETILLQSRTGITKWDNCYKVVLNTNINGPSTNIFDRSFNLSFYNSGRLPFEVRRCQKRNLFASKCSSNSGNLNIFYFLFMCLLSFLFLFLFFWGGGGVMEKMILASTLF